MMPLSANGIKLSSPVDFSEKPLRLRQQILKGFKEWDS